MLLLRCLGRALTGGSTRPLAAAALLALLACAGSAQAQATNPTPTCQPSQGSLSFLGCSVAQKLLPIAAGASVTVVDLKSDRELPAPDMLRERVQSAVKAALRSSPGEAKPPARSKLSVELRIEKNGGVLRVTAELRRATSLWQRIRHKKPSPEEYAFAEAPLDAELRALIPPPPLVVSETLKLKAPERGIVAVACGPLGADGGQELALVSRANVRVGRIAGRAFVERKKASWATLSPVAPSPLREPIANAEITAQGTLRIGLTDRRDGLELSRDLTVLGRFEALLPVAPGCIARSGVGVLAAPADCAQKPAPTRAPAVVVDAIASSPRAWLGRDALSATLTSASGAVAELARPIGAQLAVGDADSDGRLELAYSADTLEPTKDRVTLVTLGDGKLSRRFELPAPAISALAICSRREGPGMAPIVVVAGEELWLLR